MKKYIKYLVYLLIISVAGMVFYKKVYVPKHTFLTAKVSKGNVDIRVNGVGNMGAKNIYKIGTLYGGKVLNFTIEEGEYIDKNTQIANIDSVDLKDKIDEQNALRLKLLNDIKSLQIDRKSAKVNYDYQNELFLKNSKLYKLRSISSLDFQKYLTAKETAKFNIESIDGRIASLKDQIRQLEAVVNGLKQRLARYSIKSPVSGYVTKKSIVNYQMVMPNQTLIEIVDPKDIWVRTFIDTRVSGKVKLGDSASIKLRSSSKIYRGKVVNINPINNSITYEREIDVAFDNLPIPFYLEEQATVKIDISTLKNVLKIPTNVLSIYKEQNGVWTLDGDMVKFKNLKILAYEGKKVAVEGLSIDTKLVVPDPKKKSLSNGMKIYHD